MYIDISASLWSEGIRYSGGAKRLSCSKASQIRSCSTGNTCFQPELCACALRFLRSTRIASLSPAPGQFLPLTAIDIHRMDVILPFSVLSASFVRSHPRQNLRSRWRTWDRLRLCTIHIPFRACIRMYTNVYMYTSPHVLFVLIICQKRRALSNIATTGKMYTPQYILHAFIVMVFRRVNSDSFPSILKHRGQMKRESMRLSREFVVCLLSSWIFVR